MGPLKYRRNLRFSPGKAFHSWYLLASFTPVCSFQSCVPAPLLLPATQPSVPQTIPPEAASPCKFIFIDNASQSSPSPRAALSFRCTTYILEATHVILSENTVISSRIMVLFLNNPLVKRCCYRT